MNLGILGHHLVHGMQLTMPVRQLARCRWILSQLPILNDKTLYNIGVYRSSKLNTKRFIGTRNILHRDTDEIAKVI